jgi:dipeptidase E
MRLFLASTFSDTVNLFVNKVPSGKVMFIENPTDLFKSKKWVQKDFDAFIKHGFDVVKVDLRYITAKTLQNMIKDFDIIHICGGSAVYILKLLKNKGMDTVIIDAVKAGLIYTGTSAGIMITAPNISFCADDEDEKEVNMVGKLKDLSGLNLTPYYYMCHTQEKYYIPSTQKAMIRLASNKLPILFLTDDMACWFEDDRMQLLINK